LPVTASPLEIRTLGFRLRTIAGEQIRTYCPDRSNLASGYGIRGLEASPAYVWGNRGVRSRTSEGKVFLGCSDPQKIIRELDQITGSTH
jgi:hypothetical protein